MATRNVQPYVYPDRDEHGNFYKGVEVAIAQILALKADMPVRLTNFALKSINWSNWDSHGGLREGWQLLMDRKTDLIFHNMEATADRYNRAGPLYPHTMEDLTWFVPTPRVIDGASVGLLAFAKVYQWFVMFAFFCVLAGLTYMLEPKFSISDSLLRVFLIFMSLPVANTSTRPFSKIFTIFIYVWALHIFAGYQTFFFNLLLTAPTEKPILSIDDGLERGLNFSLHPPLEDTYNDSGPDWDRLLASNRWNYYKILHIFEVANNTMMALFPRFRTLGYIYMIGRDQFKRRLIQETQNKYSQLYITMFMYQGHPLQPQFRKDTLYLLQGGIPNQLMVWSISRELPPPKRLLRKGSLNIKQVSNIFGATGSAFILLMWIFTFVSEILFYNCQKWWDRFKEARKSIVRCNKRKKTLKIFVESATIKGLKLRKCTIPTKHIDKQ